MTLATPITVPALRDASASAGLGESPIADHAEEQGDSSFPKAMEQALSREARPARAERSTNRRFKVPAKESGAAPVRAAAPEPTPGAADKSPIPPRARAGLFDRPAVRNEPPLRLTTSNVEPPIAADLRIASSPAAEVEDHPSPATDSAEDPIEPAQTALLEAAIVRSPLPISPILRWASRVAASESDAPRSGAAPISPSPTPREPTAIEGAAPRPQATLVATIAASTTGGDGNASGDDAPTPALAEPVSPSRRAAASLPETREGRTVQTLSAARPSALVTADVPPVAAQPPVTAGPVQPESAAPRHTSPVASESADLARSQSTPKELSAAATSPVEASRLAELSRMPLTVSEADGAGPDDGTASAKNSRLMKNTEEMGQSLRRPEKSLPIPAKSGLAAADNAGSTPAPASPAPGKDSTDWRQTTIQISDGVAVPELGGRSAHPGVRAAASVSVPTEVRVDHVQQKILQGVVELKRVQADALTVVIKPDADTELSVVVHLRGGQIEVDAQCRRGDYPGWVAQWHQLQQSLNAHGIRLNGLQDFTPSSEWDQSPAGGFQAPSEDERELPAPPRIEPLDEAVIELKDHRYQPPQSPRLAVGGPRRWESWA